MWDSVRKTFYFHATLMMHIALVCSVCWVFELYLTCLTQYKIKCIIACELYLLRKFNAPITIT